MALIRKNLLLVAATTGLLASSLLALFNYAQPPSESWPYVHATDIGYLVVQLLAIYLACSWTANRGHYKNSSWVFESFFITLGLGIALTFVLFGYTDFASRIGVCVMSTLFTCSAMIVPSRSKNASQWKTGVGWTLFTLALFGAFFNAADLNGANHVLRLQLISQEIFFYAIAMGAALAMTRELRAATQEIIGSLVLISLSFIIALSILLLDNSLRIEMSVSIGVITVGLSVVGSWYQSTHPKSVQVPSTIFEGQLSKPILGFRAWGVTCVGYSLDDDGTKTATYGLGSINGGGTPWLSRRALAMCTQHTPVPDPDCECGLYSVPRLEQVGNWRGHLHACHHCVVGLVASWGTVCQHGEEGYRSSYQEIVALLKRGGTSEDFTTLMVAGQLDLPVMARRDLEKMMEKINAYEPTPSVLYWANKPLG